MEAFQGVGVYIFCATCLYLLTEFIDIFDYHLIALNYIVPNLVSCWVSYVVLKLFSLVVMGGIFEHGLYEFVNKTWAGYEAIMIIIFTSIIMAIIFLKGRRFEDGWSTTVHLLSIIKSLIQQRTLYGLLGIIIQSAMRRIAHSLLPSIVFDITYFQHWAIISAVVYNVWGYIGYKFIQQGIPIVWRVISMFIVSVWKTILPPSPPQRDSRSKRFHGLLFGAAPPYHRMMMLPLLVLIILIVIVPSVLGSSIDESFNVLGGDAAGYAAAAAGGSASILFSSDDERDEAKLPEDEDEDDEPDQDQDTNPNLDSYFAKGIDSPLPNETASFPALKRLKCSPGIGGSPLKKLFNKAVQKSSEKLRESREGLRTALGFHTEEDYIIDVTENVNTDDFDKELVYSECDELLQPQESNNTESYKEVTHDMRNNDSTHFAGGKFLEVHDELRKAPPNKLKGMRKVVADLIRFVDATEKEVNDKGGVTALELEKKFNKEKNQIRDTMKDHLPTEMKPLVNTANRFSIHTLVVIFLHYAPPGWRPDKDDEHDFCSITQCCIHTMKSKLLNFLYNENKHGPEKMEEWRYGGKSDLDYASRMAVVDLIPFLLEKKSTMGEMEAQYTKYAEELKLNNYYELIAISYCFARMHLLLARASHRKEKCQLHVASSAAAKHLLGLQSGISKYLQKYLYSTFNITIGPHPQIYLMGVCKSERLFPMGIREVMNRHLVEVYSVFITFKKDFSSQLMSIFGSDFAEGVNLGIYSHLAKVLETHNLLDLDVNPIHSYPAEDVVEDAKPSANNDDDPVVLHYAGILVTNGLNEIDIELFKIEMKDITIELFMKRIRKFRASARLHGIAALMPSGWATNSNVEIPAHIDSMIEIVRTTLNKSRRAIMASLLRIKAAQVQNGERLGALSKLASLYNTRGGSEGNGSVAVKAHADFITLTKSYGGDRAKAMEVIVKIAEQCDETFWTNYARLKAYIKDPKNNAVVTIEGKNVVVVYSKENGSRNDLYSWWKAQINWAGPNANATVQNQYGINAWECVGSVEYNALIELGVIFSDELVRKAYKQFSGGKSKKKKGKNMTKVQKSARGHLSGNRGMMLSFLNNIPGQAAASEAAAASASASASAAAGCTAAGGT